MIGFIWAETQNESHWGIMLGGVLSPKHAELQMQCVQCEFPFSLKSPEDSRGVQIDRIPVGVDGTHLAVWLSLLNMMNCCSVYYHCIVME